MENEFLDSATRVVLSMAAALLLHHSEVINELHDKVERCFRRMGTSPVIYRQSPALSSPGRFHGADSVRPRTPMPESYIDRLEESRTVHIDDSRGPRSVQRSVVPSIAASNRSYSPAAYDTLDDLYDSRTIHLYDSPYVGRSYRRSGSSSTSPQERSVSVIRRSAPPRRYMIPNRSIAAADDSPPRPMIPRRLFRTPELTPPPSIPRYILSPAAPGSAPSRLIRTPQTIPRAIQNRPRRGGNFTTIEPSLYRSYMTGQMPPLVRLRPLQRLLPGSLASPMMSFAKSLNVSTPHVRTPAISPRVLPDTTEEDLDGVEFPSGSYLTSSMEGSRPLHSSPVQRSHQNYTVEENLEDVEFPSGSLLTSSMEGSNIRTGETSKLNISRPLRRSPAQRSNRNDTVEENLEDVEFPSGSYLTSSMEESNIQTAETSKPNISRPLRSSPAQSRFNQNDTVEENLEDVEFPSGSFLTSSMEASYPMEETINTLFRKINRQAAIIQAGGQITPRSRIGIMRRNSDDFDFETGRMRSLPVTS